METTMATKQSNHIKEFAMAHEALCAAGFRGRADRLDAVADDYRKKDLALRAAFRVMDSHPDPRCDKHQDGDPIQCGWKQAYAEMLDALWIGW
jgi:hypothetical protein